VIAFPRAGAWERGTQEENGLTRRTPPATHHSFSVHDSRHEVGRGSSDPARVPDRRSPDLPPGAECGLARPIPDWETTLHPPPTAHFQCPTAAGCSAAPSVMVPLICKGFAPPIEIEKLQLLALALAGTSAPVNVHAGSTFADVLEV
jgi:hypothetical protein